MYLITLHMLEFYFNFSNHEVVVIQVTILISASYLFKCFYVVSPHYSALLWLCSEQKQNELWRAAAANVIK